MELTTDEGCVLWALEWWCYRNFTKIFWRCSIRFMEALCDEGSCQKLCVVTWPRSVNWSSHQGMPTWPGTVHLRIWTDKPWQRVQRRQCRTCSRTNVFSMCRHLFQVAGIVWDDRGPVPVVRCIKLAWTNGIEQWPPVCLGGICYIRQTE